MRNWNTPVNHILQFHIAFLQYLWGIETLIISSAWENIVRVFTVPMRNWNYSLLLFYSNILQGFYSTYEKLKPKYLLDLKKKYPKVFTVPMRNWNFDTPWIDKVRYCRFYSTYEELKPRRYEKMKLRKFLFLQYLWGIETWHISNLYFFTLICFYSTYEELKHPGAPPHTDAPCPFLQYLWGIETLNQA